MDSNPAREVKRSFVVSIWYGSIFISLGCFTHWVRVCLVANHYTIRTYFILGISISGFRLYEKKATTLLEKDEAATDALLASLILRQTMHRKELAEFELARAQELFKRRTIYSPITGVVLQRMLSPGETVNDRPIIRVAQINVVKVEVIIPVKYFGQVHEGMQAQVMPKYPGASARVATVTVVDRVVDAASDTFGVRLELQNPDLKIPAGVRCEIEFKVAAQ